MKMKIDKKTDELVILDEIKQEEYRAQMREIRERIRKIKEEEENYD